MKVSTTAFLLTTAMGVAGLPSSHGHRAVHRSLEKRMDFVINKKPDAPVVDQAAVVASPASTPAAPVVSQDNVAIKAAANIGFGDGAASADGGNGAATPSTSGTKKFCGGLSKRATLAQIAYKGNVGAADNYGCNLMAVDSPSGYDYVAEFDNKSGKAQKCVAWLKIGPNGGINGFFKGNEALTFDLPTDGKKYIVAEADTQGGVACGPGSLTTTNFGQYANTWFEFDFANASNQGYSGADISCLVAADNNLPIQAMQVCAKDQTCSTIQDGGAGTNAYVAGTHALDGVGLNIQPGPVTFQVTVG